MAIIGTLNPTLQDWASRTRNDKIDKIIELLATTNPVLAEMTMIEGNLPTGHLTSMRAGLPTVTWRQLNYGVPNSKSKVVQVTDAAGMLAAYSEVDKKLADLSGNTAEFRASEDGPFRQSMNNTMASTLFYGNTATDTKVFMGLAPRYNDLAAANAENIIDAGGTGSDNASVWLTTWSPDTCAMFFPKGMRSGLSHQDLGEVTLQDVEGQNYQGYRALYEWDMGLSLRNWRYVVRVCNIDTSLLIADGGVVSSGADLISSMIRAIHLLPDENSGRLVFYVDRTVMTYLDLQTFKQTNMHVTYGQDPHGKRVMMFRGIPVRKCDALVDTEARVV